MSYDPRRERKPDAQWFSDSTMKNYCCALMVGVTILGLYSFVLFNIFFFNSTEYNSLFLRVLELETDIRDETSHAIQNLNSMTTQTNAFMEDNPDFFEHIKEGLIAFTNITKLEAPSEKIIFLLDWLFDKHEHLDSILNEGQNITHSLQEFIEKSRKFEIVF